MTELQIGRYDQLLRRVGDLKGPGSKVSDVLAEVFPTFDLENVPMELLALGGWRPAWQSTERPAQATQVSASQLQNPAGSGKIAVITTLQLRIDSATFIQVQISATTFGTPVAGLFRDSRFGVPRSTTMLASSADNVTVGGGLRLRVVPDPPGQYTFHDPNGIAVITPGTNLDCGTVNINRLMTVNYWWRERQAEPSELKF